MRQTNASVTGKDAGLMPGGDAPENPDRLCGIAQHAVKELCEAHELMDQIEMSLFGPAPGSAGEPKSHPGGMENLLYELRASAASLTARLKAAGERL